MSAGIQAGVAEEFAGLISRTKAEIHKVIVGQEDLVDLTLQTIFCHNHALLMGVPGLAKTLLVTTSHSVIRRAPADSLARADCQLPIAD
jgi:MoxR-like ATPase